MAINYFTLTALHSADKFLKEQQIFGHSNESAVTISGDFIRQSNYDQNNRRPPFRQLYHHPEEDRTARQKVRFR